MCAFEKANSCTIMQLAVEGHKSPCLFFFTSSTCCLLKIKGRAITAIEPISIDFPLNLFDYNRKSEVFPVQENIDYVINYCSGEPSVN